jgi:amino acid transporter
LSSELRRSLSLPVLVLYGLGTTVGAGIYALTGKVAGQAGMLTPLSFALASALAAFTAFSFAELGGRLPRSAGEAVYVREGLHAPVLGLIVGLLVVLSGSVSAATISNGFAGYLGELLPVSRAPAAVGIVIAMGLLTAWGVRESVGVAAVITLVEVAGLLVVIGAASDHLLELPSRLHELTPGRAGWPGVFSASLLAFYAFLGFEDMVNVAEEVKDVRRTLPRAILWTLALTVVLYLALSITCVLVVPPEELGGSEAPLALVLERATGRAPVGISLVALLAMMNGALVQVIMASRVLYGLSRDGQILAAFGRVHPRTRTPLLATAAVTALVAVLAAAFELAALAEAAALVTLVVFASVNLALVGLKRRGNPPEGVIGVPVWVPLCGFAVSVGALGWRVLEAARAVG